MNLPATVSGRPVSNRGVHLAPFGFHAYWCEPKAARSYWLELMQSMGMSWCVLITDSDSCLEEFGGKPVVQWLLEAGIIPIVRWQAAIDTPFTGGPVVRRLVPIYAAFGLRPFFQIYNEPLDGREWSHSKPSWKVFVSRWNDAARQVIQAGGLPGFPDGPGYSFNPFHDIDRSVWDEGAWYGVHNYSKGRPLSYPYDDVTQHGTPLTEAEYRKALGIFADDKEWHDLPLDVINAQRAAWASPGLTAVQDDVCWNAWQKVDHYANEVLGRSVLLAMTEGGWQVRDRAGGGDRIDVRWPMTTPDMVAAKTLAMFEADCPMFCQCPWLLACSAMGGSGWEYDSMIGWSFFDEHGFEKPVVKLLQDHPPGQPPDLSGVKARLERARGLLEQAAAASSG